MFYLNQIHPQSPAFLPSSRRRTNFQRAPDRSVQTGKPSLISQPEQRWEPLHLDAQHLPCGATRRCYMHFGCRFAAKSCYPIRTRNPAFRLHHFPLNPRQELTRKQACFFTQAGRVAINCTAFCRSVIGLFTHIGMSFVPQGLRRQNARRRPRRVKRSHQRYKQRRQRHLHTI